MFLKGHYILSVLFLLLLTIVIYGLGKAVIRMTFSSKTEETTPISLGWNMYLPQIVMLFLAFLTGIYMPQSLTRILLAGVAGF